MNLICHEKGYETLDIVASLLECPFIDLSLKSTDGNNCLHLASVFG